MMFVASTIGLFAILGLAAGGSLRGLSEGDLGFRWWALVALWLLQSYLRLNLERGASVHVVAWTLVSGCLGAILYSMRGRPGMGLMALGVSCNAFVVAANQGMPVGTAGGILGNRAVAFAIAAHPFYFASNGSTMLPWMGDVLAAPSGMLVSIGDLLALVGAGVLIVDSMLDVSRSRALASPPEGEIPCVRLRAPRS